MKVQILKSLEKWLFCCCCIGGHGDLDIVEDGEGGTMFMRMKLAVVVLMCIDYVGECWRCWW